MFLLRAADIETISGLSSHGETEIHTQMREHAPEDGEGRGGLLVELPKGGTRQLLEVLGELERGGLAD